ncbi:MAG: 16S rRNA (uracil(1498)-N(3))-methyltransferase [Fusobacterium mortiferum]|jgi:16S rRNA (uracil1498-N3)-methyltransferase|uniref:Ribosomal RNA small subunit methyltransferase E n=2 Tax=Fusobacterium mortiferum TaxID=850 RepID=A0A414PZH5_FUSMR|nr:MULTISPECIES: 16S rRNA (uracil(1498)-N(3))-methyltransferase [Fusobacterium]AVQ18429.1 16S rRNA (uracil(1498)-N(3))-methyltransferase [Fusobacterium mortiferum ATCC 9817]EEO34667.1 RNA methyltransferase, RsmE family [Fusobacterium mortiferum ATCC 9817]MCF2699556.1 16S rRNA (uracil(1498)-N(3))-methyltransferase [Fusobacterium mortiferum]MCI6382107.1 16S rRNA (uracil(1498)-N(3))-methyltransferase [Fusobacterium mortiferum]MCI7187314.1 16S rRNA (uracil(1498)-N(3))-methyltransferase [Fusobacter
MISVIISEENILENKIIIDEKGDVNHLKNVFRVKIDEKVRAVDGEKEYLCRVAELDKKSVTLVIDEIFEDRFSTKVKIDAAIGILKNDKMDLTIQKLTEIGINKIIPLSTKRGVAKVSEKKDKWDLIVREALKQCQGVKPLIIDEVTKIEKLKLEDYDLVIVPYECEDEYTLKNLLRKQTKELKSVLYIVGPEGGFDIEEIEYLKQKGANIVTLGKRILRAETASIVVGGVLINEFQ